MDLRLLIIFVFQSLKLDDAVKCPIENCRHCTTTDECSVCTLGWFGETCEHRCRGNQSTCSMCSDSYLRKTSLLDNQKNCFGCKQNEYFTNCECRQCPNNCSMCNESNYCKKCKAGYFGTSCQNECPTNCVSCESAASCHSCKDEWLGVSCQCNRNCLKVGNMSEWCSINGTCKKGCIKGKRGSMCDLDCDRKNFCIECDQSSYRCLKCTNGLYGRNYCDKKCGNCSPNEKGDIECDIESGECSNGCNNGFFGIKCDNKCSPGCNDTFTNLNNCDNETGQCKFGCLLGMYGDKCDLNCSVHCSNNTCDQSTGQCNNGCVLGWFSLNCTNTCSNTCVNRSCNASSGYCDIGCKPGWYGDSCQDICSIKCVNKSCAMQSGLCNYEDGNEDVGISGKNSPQSCNGKCKNNVCDRQKSWCLLGCEVGYDGLYCNETLQADFGAIVILTNCGIAGALIELTFIFLVCFAIRYAHCKMPIRRRHVHIFKRKKIDSVYDEIREKADVKCPIENCRHCTTTDECSVCTLGWFGETCEHRCRGNQSTCSMCSDSYLRKTSLLDNQKNCFGCKQNEYFTNGECRQCPNNCSMCNESNYCKKCKAGYFGTSCQNECPTNCVSCESATSCHSCKDEWLGVSCQCNRNCLKVGNMSEWCSINGTCKKGCIKGKRGSMCDLDCDRKNFCIECDQSSYRCLKCTNGLYGRNYCDKKCGNCSPNEKGDIECDIESGECSNGCNNGFFGIKCDNKCSPGCNDTFTNLNNCDNETGQCKFGCLLGMYGDKCDLNCSVHCSNNTCDQSTGQCNNGCVLGWFSLNCTNTCSNTCVNRSCNASSGYCDIGCKPGWYGDSCQDICSIKCVNKSCAMQSGLCNYEDGNEDVGISGKNSPQSCNGKCKNNVCDRQKSWCLLGCEVGYDGLYCNETLQADFGAIVILINCGIAGALIELTFIFLVCFAIRYAHCKMPIRRRHVHIFKRKKIDSVYDEIREKADEMAILTNCTGENVHFDTIADSAPDIASYPISSGSKDEYYSTVIDTKDRYNEYTDLTYLTLNNSSTNVPRLPPRIKANDSSNTVMKDALKTSEDIECNYQDIDLMKADGKFSKSSQMSKTTYQDGRQTCLQLESSFEMKDDDCDYLHPVC